MSAAERQSKRKVRSVTETATDERVAGAATALSLASSDDFVAFVRSALTKVNSKLDSIIAQQVYLDTKLADIDDRVSGQATVIADLTETVELNAKSIREQLNLITDMKKTISDATRDVQIATTSPS